MFMEWSVWQQVFEDLERQLPTGRKIQLNKTKCGMEIILKFIYKEKKINTQGKVGECSQCLE